MQDDDRQENKNFAGMRVALGIEKENPLVYTRAARHRS
jgi:hypothetical protein